MVCPHSLVNDLAISVDDVDHIGHRAVKAVHGALKIIYKHRVLNTILPAAVTRKVEFLFPALVRAVMLARMRFAHINCKKLKALIFVTSVKLVQGRDLADEGRSSNTAEFQQNMFFVAEIGKPYSRSLDARQLEI